MTLIRNSYSMHRMANRAQRVPWKSRRIYYFQSLKRTEHGEKKVILFVHITSTAKQSGWFAVKCNTQNRWIPASISDTYYPYSWGCWIRFVMSYGKEIYRVSWIDILFLCILGLWSFSRYVINYILINYECLDCLILCFSYSILWNVNNFYLLC